MIRDIVFLVLLVVMTLVVLIIYMKVTKVLDLAKRTLQDVENIVSTVSEKVVAPATAGSGIAFGAGKMAAFLFGASRKRRKKDKDEE